MNLTLFVQFLKKTHKFVARLHTHSSPTEFFLDPMEFYEKWGKGIPAGTHHEIEILEPSPEVLQRVPLHVHKSERSGTFFVCYPLAIPTEQKAEEVFTLWCVGTVGTWERGVDLNTIYDECAGDARFFFKIMLDRYTIHAGYVIKK